MWKTFTLKGMVKTLTTLESQLTVDEGIKREFDNDTTHTVKLNN